MESYSQSDVIVLREVYQIFRREFIVVRNIDVFLETITIEAVCNKVLRKMILKPNAVCLIPTAGYSVNLIYSKKSLMWLVYMEQSDDCIILYWRNVRDYRLPDLPISACMGSVRKRW